MNYNLFFKSAFISAQNKITIESFIQNLSNPRILLNEVLVL